ncbi:dTDP-glucose 4,6-dehydratase [Marininema halotolerans]|uniref:dTDP-glucose 4,6-dehydratase n=1 Tax=Marininema halotolerans TaxID=1155944 RepID=A0A1I6R8B2_9BACL|nr:dTDP-glucose 4,6-dehydratase [Marininema halotolerans]SFS60770.1 dTDP-glucose 4,6-dehydratase [Marininema halotolerans]
MRRVLVTGGAGFIGSHYVHHLLSSHSDIEVINADALTYSANLQSLADIELDPRYRFIQVDLANQQEVEELFANPIDEVVHFAAESHVDRSIQGAEAFIRSNILGTYRLLEAIRHAGNLQKMIHISTDEVYGSIMQGRTKEGEALAPGNPYSASKAGSDLLCLAYFNTYQTPVVLTRCTNNYGPWQHPEKFIPKSILHALENQPLPLYGTGTQERDWIHVTDHCMGVDRVREAGRVGEVYHIGAEQPVSNRWIAENILDQLGKPHSLIQHTKDRLGHDYRYSLQTTKMREELGWEPLISLEQGLKETVAWYRQRWERGEGNAS